MFNVDFGFLTWLVPADFTAFNVPGQERYMSLLRQLFWLHLLVWAMTGVLLAVIWVLATRHSMPWFLIPICAWAIFLGAHAVYAFIMHSPQEILMEREHRTERGTT